MKNFFYVLGERRAASGSPCKFCKGTMKVRYLNNKDKDFMQGFVTAGGTICYVDSNGACLKRVV